MNRQRIINKTIKKLSMLGKPKDPISLQKKEKLLKGLWNEKNPKKVYEIIQKEILRLNPSKEATQDLFKFFKLKGLFKRSLSFHKDMEKSWRHLLKENGLKGFLLEN